jgi:hypothetical protein
VVGVVFLCVGLCVSAPLRFKGVSILPNCRDAKCCAEKAESGSTKLAVAQ